MVQRPGMLGAPAFWLAFLTQDATSNFGKLPRQCLWSTLVPWLLLSLGAWTNSAHGVYFTELTTPAGRLVRPGPLSMLAKVWVYLLLLASAVLLSRHLAALQRVGGLLADNCPTNYALTRAPAAFVHRQSRA